MSTFATAVVNRPTRTANGMRAHATSGHPVLDLFYQIGAARGQNIIPTFVAALVAHREWALRVALWARDVRGGAGERQLFRDIVQYLVVHDPLAARAVIAKIPEIGRWDDLLVIEGPLQAVALAMIAEALTAKNGLCAKWMPRQGEIAVRLRRFLGLSPKRYRKLLVELTNVVETKMCAQMWDSIEFAKVPSVAAARYKRAFNRRTSRYADYVALVKNGLATVNSGAVYPYDVLKGLIGTNVAYDAVEIDLVVAQWNALPNYVGDASILPLVDVSGSMTDPCASGLSALDVAVSLGLYLADKNHGAFRDTFVTFSAQPQLLHLKGNVVQKLDQMVKSDWEMNTNLHAAMREILRVALAHQVPAAQMPRYLLILSDMQFDACVAHDDSAIQMMARQYAVAGYAMPVVIFWNINNHDNIPVQQHASGAMLVSGFSPGILKAVMKAEMDSLTPLGLMLSVIMDPRYDLALAE
ncbi:MAG: DUF2828 family protein [Chloroflexi bacterium]|nr:MAG: DUF2828 family protein [Chloroflexota bacterium]